MAAFAVTGSHVLNTPLGDKAFYEDQWIGASNRVVIPLSYSGDLKRTAVALGAVNLVLTIHGATSVQFTSANTHCELDYRPLLPAVLSLQAPVIRDDGTMAMMEIPTNAIPVDIPDAYVGTLRCAVPWRSLTETGPQDSTEFTVALALQFGSVVVAGPELVLDTVATATGADWEVAFTTDSVLWDENAAGLHGSGSGFLRLGLTRGGGSTETYRGAPGTFCTVAARPVSAAAVVDGGAVTVSVVPPVAPSTIMATGYCHIPVTSLLVHGAGEDVAHGTVLVVSMYFPSAPPALTANSSLGFVDGWISRSFSLDLVRCFMWWVLS